VCQKKGKNVWWWEVCLIQRKKKKRVGSRSKIGRICSQGKPKMLGLSGTAWREVAGRVNLRAKRGKSFFFTVLRLKGDYIKAWG